MRSFASDNNSGAHPVIWKALEAANADHAVAYGDDSWTARAVAAIQGTFATEGPVLFVYNGTGANVTAMAALTRSYEAVICTEMAHLHVDECGAPERIAGCKLLTVPSDDGKLTVADIERFTWLMGDCHHPQPKVVSITQATELGQVYEPAEISALSACCREHDLFLHMDGARIANAAAAKGCTLKEMVTDTGVDVLSFGGTKNGLMFGEAVVFLRPELGERAQFYRKQSAQLSSKMRFIAAQFEALIHDDLWLRNASQANAMARLLAERMAAAGVEVTQDVHANAVFARLDPALCQALQQEFFFYVWNAATDEVRWMTSFDTTEDDIDAFVAALQVIRADLRGNQSL